MKGYPTAEGYMGYIDGEYLLFDTEEGYKEVYLCFIKLETK